MTNSRPIVGTAVEEIHQQIVQWTWRKGGVAVGLCGSQGSGKSTAAAAVAERLRTDGCNVAVLSLDDFYLTASDRERLARSVHPLLAVRGVPGTHDVELAIETLASLRRPGPTSLPRFDKAADDRVATSPADIFDGPADVVLFEGWCMGAQPQTEEALREPINALEREEDPEGRWRRFVNEALAGSYQRLFACLDRSILLAAPSFDVVLRWRRQQESELRSRLVAEGQDLARTMDDRQLSRFVSHYERLTRHILAELPSRADLILYLDKERRVIARDGTGLME